MDYLRSFAVSAAGMEVERTRVEVASMNLANANLVQPTSGAGYQPLRVLAMPGASFSSLVDEGFAATLPEAQIEAQAVPPRRVLDPGHPLADAQGFVAYPGVDPATEMVSLMAATRSYEANVAAMNTARSLALKTLEIGRNA